MFDVRLASFARLMVRSSFMTCVAVALLVASCAPRAGDRTGPSVAAAAPPDAAVLADAAAVMDDAAAPAAPSARGVTQCGPSTERAASRDGYPPRRKIASDAERAAIEARFRADNAAVSWRTVTVSPFGFVAYANAAMPYPSLDARGDRAAANATFARQAAYFGISPALLPILAACGDDKTYAGARFVQYWGPHVAATLTFANHGGTLVGFFLEDLPPPPAELDDSRLTSSLVGRNVTIKTTSSFHHPMPPGARAPRPTVTTTRRPLTARDVRVARVVEGRVSTDRAVAELRVVAVVDVAVQGDGMPQEHSFETSYDVTFDAPAPKLPLHLDAVTGESLDARQLVYPLPPHQ